MFGISRHLLATYLGRARFTVHMSASLPLLRAKANTNSSNSKEPTEQDMFNEVDLQKLENGHSKLLLPRGPLRQVLKKVKTLYLAGGGGAGRAYPAAISEAAEFGLDLNNVTEVNATSVGTIQGIMIVLGYTAKEMKDRLIKMPAADLQDWNFKSFFTFFKRWGLCYGKSMRQYFEDAIFEKTKLKDPTFKQLYDAGYTKEFRVITTNVTKREMAVFSYKNTPDVSVSWVLAVACGVPIMYPPGKLRNKKGEEEIFTDGGITNNYPWGIGSDPEAPLEDQLGFVFDSQMEAFKDKQGKSILKSFWHYIYTLIWISLFHNPIPLSENVKLRTVKLKVRDHNPLNFTATKFEQANLDRAGKIGVRKYIRDWLEIKREKAKENTVEHQDDLTFALSCTKAYHLYKHRVKHASNGDAPPVILSSVKGVKAR